MEVAKIQPFLGPYVTKISCSSLLLLNPESTPYIAEVRELYSTTCSEKKGFLIGEIYFLSLPRP